MGGLQMLGKHVGSMSGTTSNKALPSNGGGMPRMETRATTQGKLAGVDVMGEATYQAELVSNGSWIGECPNSGIIMTADGVATFRANGCGNMTEAGGVEFRGCVIFETTAPSLSSLNGKAHMYTWDVDAEGNAQCEIWEPK